MTFIGKNGSFNDHPVVITQKLGEGGQASVHAITITYPEGDTEDMAMKVDSSGGTQKRFGHEASLPFEHIRNTVSVNGPFQYTTEATGETYKVLLMDKIEGAQDLKKHGAGNFKPMDPRDVVSVMCQVSQTLHDSEKAGIVHGDIKPQNIMFNRESKDATVIDWGGFVPEGEQRACMTYDYADPDLYRGPATDARQDVYALGLSTAEMVTGKYAKPIVQSDEANSFKQLQSFYANDTRQPKVADPHLQAIIHEATMPERADRSRAIDVMSNLAAFEEARQQFSPQDINEVAAHIVQKASNPDHFESRPLLAASAKGMMNVLPVDHEAHDQIKMVSSLDHTFESKLLARKQGASYNQSVQQLAALQETVTQSDMPTQGPSHAPTRGMSQ